MSRKGLKNGRSDEAISNGCFNKYSFLLLAFTMPNNKSKTNNPTNQKDDLRGFLQSLPMEKLALRWKLVVPVSAID